jgi:hypothetical protein
MNNLAIATLELCIDDKDYEKIKKTFGQYANFTRFLERVQSGKEINKSRWVKQTPRATIFKVSSNWGDSGWKRERADVELFKKTIQ